MRGTGGPRRWVALFDSRVDDAFDRHARGRPVLDRLFYSASALGDFSLLWHLLGAVRGLRSDRDARAAVRLSACLGVESALVNGVLKSILPRNRPVAVGVRPHTLRMPKTTSFPSGHASSGFMAASLLVDDGGSPAVWYPLATVVALSRVHVRIHHASDVAAGAAVGLALARVARRAWPDDAAPTSDRP